MFFKVLRAPMAFFDGPVGRVLNRFSKDLGITDETLPYIAQDVLAVSRRGICDGFFSGFRYKRIFSK